MAVHGYITHAARNRRFTFWLVAAYVTAFQLIGVFAAGLFILIFDHENTPLTNPAGYALRYGLPMALLSLFLFWRMYRGHATFVTRALDIRIVTRAEEPRFVGIAEEQCTALGVRVPRFGLIDVDRATQKRTLKPSAHHLGAVARGGGAPG